MNYISNQLAEKLEVLVDFYNKPNFITLDPISIPHRFSRKEDIEIAGFFSAILAWGNRKSIIKSASKLLEMMDNAPFDFIINHSESDLLGLNNFVHRTFNAYDAKFFISSLSVVYKEYGGLEQVFTSAYLQNKSVFEGLVNLRQVVLQPDAFGRSKKHMSNPAQGSAAKRLNMFLRWMVRCDHGGVDFGLWKNVSPAHLMLPLDVHTGRVSRKLGLLQRKNDDWKAVEEITTVLRLLDPTDPVKYDFALFGMSVDGGKF